MSRRRPADVWSTPTVRRRRIARTERRMPRVQILDTEGRWDANNEDEILWWPRVQWIDPGGVSGVAVVWFDPKALLVDNAKTAKVVLAYSEMFLHGPENGRLGQIDQFLRIRELLDQEQGLATGCESFTPRRLDMNPEFYSPIRIRAALDYEMSRLKPLGADAVGNGIPLHVQSPSDAINAFTNDRLKALRMYTPGPDHVNDAKRHCLLFIRKIKQSNRGLEFFKKTFGDEDGWWSR